MSCQNCCSCRKGTGRPREVEAPPLIIESNEPPATGIPISTYLVACAIVAAVLLNLFS